MKLSLIAFGKLKSPGLEAAADYYRKLIRTWVPIQEIELKPMMVPDKSPATRAKIQQKEAIILEEKLESLLTGRGVFYLLDEGGKTRTTQAWAELVTQWESSSIPEVAICVGSSLGFSAGLRNQANGIISLGPQTLPHELARVVLLEQLYRAWSVTRGHPYHVQG